MAYKIVVDAGHGGCALRRDVDDGISGVRGQLRTEPQEWARLEEILEKNSFKTWENGRGECLDFRVERVFSEGLSGKEVLERGVSMLLRQMEELLSTEGRDGYDG